MQYSEYGYYYLILMTKNMAIINSKINIKTLALATSACLVLGLSSCCDNGSCDTKTECQTTQNDSLIATTPITAEEVAEAQKAWGEGIVKIGKAYMVKRNYKQLASDHVKKFYNYDEGTVLFKPTFASEKQFRLGFEGALSYFVGGNENYPEDHGFAIKPWTKVRFENAGTIIDADGDTALAMGNYFFTPADGSPEVKVEYTFAYKKDKDGNLKIVLHGSHLPYRPKAH